MNTRAFKVVVEPDVDFDGHPAGWRAFCPALEREGGASWGTTEAEALRHVNGIVQRIVATFIAEGRPLPEDSAASFELPKIPRKESRVVITV